jgi:hypothetical protein
LLGFEELVDVGLGKTDGLGEVGNRGFFVAVKAEVLGRGQHDLVPHIMVGRASGRGRMGAFFTHVHSLPLGIDLHNE